MGKDGDHNGASLVEILDIYKFLFIEMDSIRQSLWFGLKQYLFSKEHTNISFSENGLQCIKLHIAAYFT